MPLVKVETRRGLTAEQKKMVLDAVHSALVTACDMDLGFEIEV